MDTNRTVDQASDPRARVAESRAALQRTAEGIAKGLALLERARESLHISEQLFADLGGDSELPEALIRQGQSLRAQLRAAVTVHARRMQADSAPPQEMLVLIKATVGAAARSALPSRQAQDLISQAARWAIDAYYSAA
jgi:hypothetical protein